jgi:hypothetical protein
MPRLELAPNDKGCVFIDLKKCSLVPRGDQIRVRFPCSQRMVGHVFASYEPRCGLL